MFAVLYRWRVKVGMEEEFSDAWGRATEAIYRMKGSLGSRLMRAPDGDFYALAQWPTREMWLERNQPTAANTTASHQMREAIEHAFPPVELDVVEDLVKDGVFELRG